jgi:hypothetical protein
MFVFGGHLVETTKCAHHHGLNPQPSLEAVGGHPCRRGKSRAERKDAPLSPVKSKGFRQAGNFGVDDRPLSAKLPRKIGGRDRDRTCDLMLAKHALSQLSYTPTVFAYK